MDNLESFGIPSFKKGSGIHIKKKNRGKFTEYCNGKVTQKCIDKAKKSGNKTLVKRATFAENARKWKHQKGGSLYSAGNVVNTLYENNDVHEKLGTPWHNYDFTQSEEWADAHGYFPDEKGHRDDRVKKEAHPSHPSQGRWNKPGTKFYLSEKGMQDPNHTLFGLADGGQDPQATLYYKNGIVLPEITVTPNESYVHNTYDNIKLSSKHKKGGPVNITDNSSIKLISKKYQKGGPVKKSIWDEATQKEYELGADGYYTIPIDGVERKVAPDGQYTLTSEDGMEMFDYFDVGQVKPIEIQYVPEAQQQKAPKPIISPFTNSNKLLPGETTPESFLRGRYDIYKNNLQEYLGDGRQVTDEMAKESLDTAIDRMKATPASQLNFSGIFNTPWFQINTTDTSNTPESISDTVEEQLQKEPSTAGFFFTNPSKEDIKDGVPVNASPQQRFDYYKNLADDSNRYKNRYIAYLDTVEPGSKEWDALTAHERAHALMLRASESVIRNKNIKPISGEKDSYLDDPKEIFARVKSVQAQGMNPSETYDANAIKDWIKKTGVTDLMDRYSDEDLEFLFNQVASNDQFNIQMPEQINNTNPYNHVYYSKQGSKLIPKNQKGSTETGIKKLDLQSLRSDPEYKNYDWYINDANINALQDSLINRNANFAQRLATLAMVIPESGGKTDPHGNGAHGLVGWRGSRAVNLPKHFGGQAHKLMLELFDNPTGKDWTHGGKGTGVMTGREMYQLYNTTQNVDQATKAIMKGYVRPETSEYEKRLAFAQLLKRHMK